MSENPERGAGGRQRLAIKVVAGPVAVAALYTVLADTSS